MWNCRNVKKSCMCAERRRKKRKEILLPCQQVSTKPGTARKERGRRARGRKTERRLDTNLLKISIRRFRWNISVKRDGFWSRTEPAGSSAVCYLVSSIQKNLRNEKEKVFRRFKKLLYNQDYKLCVFIRVAVCLKSFFFFFLLKSLFLLQIPPSETDWALLNLFCVWRTHISRLRYTEFDSLFLCECLFLFLSKVVTEILFWQQKPKISTGLCRLFSCSLWQQHLDIRLSLVYPPVCYLFAIGGSEPGGCGSWYVGDKNMVEKGKRATVAGRWNADRFSTLNALNGCTKKAKRKKMGPDAVQSLNGKCVGKQLQI